MKKTMTQLIFCLVIMALPFCSMGQTNVFSLRSLFEAQLSPFIIDDYENTGYLSGDIHNGSTLDIHSNAHMSSILGETDYTSTGWDNWNFITLRSGGNHVYCAGCNGSYLMDLTSTSIGGPLGVFGAGVDIMAGTTYHAFITFGDNSQQDFALPNSPAFFGITSNLLIKSIHMGLEGGGTTQGGYLEIDNLTIGAPIPEPSSLLLLGSGLLGFVAYARVRMRRKKKE